MSTKSHECGGAEANPGLNDWSKLRQHTILGHQQDTVPTIGWWFCTPHVYKWIRPQIEVYGRLPSHRTICFSLCFSYWDYAIIRKSQGGQSRGRITISGTSLDLDSSSEKDWYDMAWLDWLVSGGFPLLGDTFPNLGSTNRRKLQQTEWRSTSEI